MPRNFRCVSLGAIRENVRRIKASMPDDIKLLAVCKADGYGHGSVQTAKAAIDGGADFLAVAAVAEGVVLRDAGIDIPILNLGIASDEENPQAVEDGITLTICEASTVRKLEKTAASLGKTAEVHLKIDTGMNRIGVRSEAEIADVLSAIHECPHVKMTGAFTHFASCDGDNMDYTDSQLARFNRLTKFLPEGILLHCANSAGIHRQVFCGGSNQMARAGISMYGYPPCETTLQLSPAMSWFCQVEFVKEVAPGDKIGYGCTYTAGSKMRIATITCGYGDGYLRSASGKAKVLINGTLCPVVGRICMDQMMVDVTNAGEVNPGDIVCLMGKMGDSEITAEDIASWAGTISYEVLLSTSSRVKIIYT